MSILVVGSTKGGVGKSSLATEVAGRAVGEGIDVVLVDMDPQQHAAAWVAWRDQAIRDGRRLEPVPCQRLTAEPELEPSQNAARLIAAVRDLQKRYELLVIDVGGYDSVEMRTVLQAAVAVVAPIVPSQWNVAAWRRFRSIVETARITNPQMTVLGVINQVSTHAVLGPREERDSREFLEPHFAAEGFRLADAVLRTRSVWRTRREDGIGLDELAGPARDPKANREMAAVYREVIDALS